jgi:hypothetical protein
VAYILFCKGKRFTLGIMSSEGESPEPKKLPKVKTTDEEQQPPPPPKTKTFRVLNTGHQTLYLTLPGRTLVLSGGSSADVPATDIVGNYHVKVMVRRGHIALFEY